MIRMPDIPGSEPNYYSSANLERDREDLTIFRSLFRLHISRFQISPEADHILRRTNSNANS